MSDKKTIREAFAFAKDSIRQGGGMPTFMAIQMLESIEKNLDAGKKLDDTIEFGE